MSSKGGEKKKVTAKQRFARVEEFKQLKAKGLKLYICETINGPGALTKCQVYTDRFGYKWFKSEEKFVA